MSKQGYVAFDLGAESGRAMLATLGLVSDGTYALASGSIGSWLRRRRSIAGIQRRVSAAIYAMLGIGTALVGERR